MTINNGISFLYNGQSSEEFGISLASSFGSVSRTGNSENRNIITTKNSFTNLFNFHYIQYNEPLKFDIIIYNIDGSWIDAYKERQLKKWLLNSKPSWFQVDQDDLSDVFYWAIGTSCEIIDVGVYSGGMKVSFQTMEPWAWSGLRKKSYTTSNGTLTFNLNMDLDYDDYIVYPQIVATSLGTGNISIKNNTTNELITITGCVLNEVITIDCKNDKVKTNLNTVMLDRWNKVTLGINENINNFTLSGNFSMQLIYRLPIRIGA